MLMCCINLRWVEVVDTYSTYLLYVCISIICETKLTNAWLQCPRTWYLKYTRMLGAGCHQVTIEHRTNRHSVIIQVTRECWHLLHVTQKLKWTGCL